MGGSGGTGPPDQAMSWKTSGELVRKALGGLKAPFLYSGPLIWAAVDSLRFPVRVSEYCQKIACPSAKEMPVPSA